MDNFNGLQSKQINGDLLLQRMFKINKGCNIWYFRRGFCIIRKITKCDFENQCIVSAIPIATKVLEEKRNGNLSQDCQNLISVHLGCVSAEEIHDFIHFGSSYWRFTT